MPDYLLLSIDACAWENPASMIKLYLYTDGSDVKNQ